VDLTADLIIRVLQAQEASHDFFLRLVGERLRVAGWRLGGWVAAGLCGASASSECMRGCEDDDALHSPRPPLTAHCTPTPHHDLNQRHPTEMLSALAACLDPAKSPAPLRTATHHVISFVTATDPVPLAGDGLRSELQAVVDAVMSVVPSTRLYDQLFDEDGEEGDDEDEAGGSAGDSVDDESEVVVVGGNGDGEEVHTEQWSGGLGAYERLRRRVETHRRVRAEHIQEPASEVRWLVCVVWVGWSVGWLVGWYWVIACFACDAVQQASNQCFPQNFSQPTHPPTRTTPQPNQVESSAAELEGVLSSLYTTLSAEWPQFKARAVQAGLVQAHSDAARQEPRLLADTASGRMWVQLPDPKRYKVGGGWSLCVCVCLWEGGRVVVCHRGYAAVLNPCFNPVQPPATTHTALQHHHHPKPPPPGLQRQGQAAGPEALVHQGVAQGPQSRQHLHNAPTGRGVTRLVGRGGGGGRGGAVAAAGAGG